MVEESKRRWVEVQAALRDLDEQGGWIHAQTVFGRWVGWVGGWVGWRKSRKSESRVALSLSLSHTHTTYKTIRNFD